MSVKIKFDINNNIKIIPKHLPKVMERCKEWDEADDEEFQIRMKIDDIEYIITKIGVLEGDISCQGDDLSKNIIVDILKRVVHPPVKLGYEFIVRPRRMNFIERLFN